MNRFRDILIVCDAVPNLDEVLDRGLWLARANGARVTLVDVMTTPSESLIRRLTAVSEVRARDIGKGIFDEYRARLDRGLAAFREAGIEADAEVLTGTPFVEVIGRVLGGGHDLVLKGAGPGPSGGLSFVSDDMHLMRKCPCPVWILKAGQPGRSRRVIAAVDPATDEETQQGLDRTVMELATSLAERDSAALHVVHAWHLPEEDVMRGGRFALSEREMAALLDDERERHRRAVTGLMGQFRAWTGRANVALIKGRPGEAIPAYAAEHGIDTVVMGTVGRTGVRGFFIGNTAETILGAVASSVLTVKPSGFRSPVAA